MKSTVFALACLASFLTVDNARCAEIFASDFPGYDSLGIITVLGRIVPGDQEKFREQVLKVLRKNKFVGDIKTFSMGGDVDTALHIGRQIRTLQGHTAGPTKMRNGAHWCAIDRTNERGQFSRQILQFDSRSGRGDPNCDCASACFLIWAGGISRAGEIIGIHRPRYDKQYYGGLSVAQAREQYQTSIDKGGQYLREMEIPDEIIRRMFSVSSTDMQYLSAMELRTLGALPFFEELILARCGREPGQRDDAPLHVKYNTCKVAVAAELAEPAKKKYLEKYR